MRLLLLVCFFLSGLSGLIYEVLWTRKLSLILGSTTLSVSLTLAAYLGGLAVGALLLGRLADRPGRPALVYALMEAGVGFYGLLSPTALDALGPLYVRLHQTLMLPYQSESLLQFILVFLVLLFPTALMGGTLPIILRAATGAGSVGGRLASLYAANTAGGILGVALTTFLLLPRAGIQASLLLAAGVNLLLAVVVLGVFAGRRAVQTAPMADAGSFSFHDEPEVPAVRLAPILLAAIVFTSGFGTLFHEVVWTRALELVLGSSTWAFGLMLTTVLAGLAGGVAIGGALIRRKLVSPFGLSLLFLAIGLSAYITVLLIPRLSPWFIAGYTRFGDVMWGFALWQSALCAVSLLLPSLMAGTVFPLAVEMGTAPNAQEGWSVGRLYALSTFGCIGGAIVAGIVAIPGIGIHKSLLLGVGLNLALALAVAARSGPIGHWRQLVTLALSLMLGTVLLPRMSNWDPLMMTIGPYAYAPEIMKIGPDRYLEAERAATLLFYKEGPVGTVAVKEIGTNRVLSIDGRAEGNLVAIAQTVMGHVPFATGYPVKDGFIIGLGTGATAGAVTRHSIEAVEVVELEPAVLEAAAFFEQVNYRALADPRVRVVIADARSRLYVASAESYDLIASQPSNPWVSGAAKLFTFEFYQLAHARLRSAGMLVQWVQLSRMDYASVMTLLKTFTRVFPETLVLEVGRKSGEILLLGFKDRARLSWPALKALFDDPAVAGELARLAVPTRGALFAHLLLGPREIPRLVEGYPINTDDNALIEVAALGSLYRDTTAKNIQTLRQSAGDPLLYLSDAPEGQAKQALLIEMADAALLALDFKRSLEFARKAVQTGETSAAYRTLGDALYVHQGQEEAVTSWRRALILDPDDQKSLRRLVRHYRSQGLADRPPEYKHWCAQLRDPGTLCG